MNIKMFVAGACFLPGRDKDLSAPLCNAITRRVLATIVSSGKVISIIQSECVFVALVIQLAIVMCHIVICGLPDSTISFHIVSQTPRSNRL